MSVMTLEHHETNTVEGSNLHGLWNYRSIFFSHSPSWGFFMRLLKNLCHLFCNYKRAFGGDKTKTHSFNSRHNSTCFCSSKYVLNLVVKFLTIISHYGKRYQCFILFAYSIIKNPIQNKNHRHFRLLFCLYILGIYFQNTRNIPWKNGWIKKLPILWLTLRIS